MRDDSVILPVLSSLSLKTSSVVRLNYFGSSNSLINELFDCDIPQKLQTHRIYSRDKQHTVLLAMYSHTAKTWIELLELSLLIHFHTLLRKSC